MPDLWMDVDVALSEVPVNILPLLDDTDFKTRETAIVYNSAGMDLVWNFVTPAGAYTQTAVTPTTSGVYDWANQGDGMYSIEIPASGGGSINNDTEGFGWFTGVVTGVLPWRGPVIGFRAAGLNDALIENAYSTTRGLAGTALPNAAAEAAGGLYTRGTGAGQIGQTTNGQADVRVAAMATDTVTAAAIATDAGAEVAAAIWDLATSGHTTAGTFGAQVKTLLDLIATYIDTEVAAIKAKTDNLPATPAATGDAMTLTSSERNSVADALLDRSNGIETSITPRQTLRVVLAALAGKLSGAGTTTITIRNVGDTKDRLTATVDAPGNRSAVTVDGT